MYQNELIHKNVPHWLKQTNFAPSFQNRIVSRQVSTRCVADHLCTCRAASRNALPRLHTGDLASSHTHSPRSRALSCGLAQRTAPDPGCMRVPPRSRGLAGVCMPAHAHTSPALNSCPSVCRQHTGPGPCQCLLVCERCCRQPRRTVTRGLLRGRVFAHPHMVMQGWVRELPQGQQASRQAVLLPGSGSVRCPHLQDLKNRIIRTAHQHHPQHRMAA